MFRVFLLTFVLFQVNFIAPAIANNVQASFLNTYDNLKSSDPLTGRWTTFSDMLNPTNTTSNVALISPVDVNIFLKKGYFYEYDNIALLKNDIHFFTSFKFVKITFF